MRRVSIVVPVYCGAHTVPELVARLAEALNARVELEVVLVDDGSPDDSSRVCRELAAAHPWVRAVLLARNFSEHNAVMAGLRFATGDCVVVMDDDLQNPPSEVVKLVDELEKGYDVVYGRYERKQHGWIRNLGSALHDRTANWGFSKPRELYLCSFKAITRSLVDELTKFDGPFPHVDGLVLRATRNIGVVTVQHHARTVGRSGQTPRKLVGLWIRTLPGFSRLPLGGEPQFVVQDTVNCRSESR